MRLVLLVVSLLVARGCSGAGSSYRREITMPGVSPSEPDAYLCTQLELDASLDEWVVRFDPLASANTAHHMLLYACSGVPQKTGFWDCHSQGTCTNGDIMYAWAKNAPSTVLPPGVGFLVGGSSGKMHLVLQVHYAVALPHVQDHSGLSLHFTTEQPVHKAGILLMVVKSSMVIPPHQTKAHGDVACLASRAKVVADINVFGYRVHTHGLGVVVSGYKHNPETGETEEIAKGNPQWPQAFYPRTPSMRIAPSDVVAARCTYDSTSRTNDTFIGWTNGDEMCNLYLMYYTDRESGPGAARCYGVQYPAVLSELPPTSDQPLPSNPLLEAEAKGENTNLHSVVTYSPVLYSLHSAEAEQEHPTETSLPDNSGTGSPSTTAATGEPAAAIGEPAAAATAATGEPSAAATGEPSAAAATGEPSAAAATGEPSAAAATGEPSAAAATGEPSAAAATGEPSAAAATGEASAAAAATGELSAAAWEEDAHGGWVLPGVSLVLVSLVAVPAALVSSLTYFVRTKQASGVTAPSRELVDKAGLQPLLSEEDGCYHPFTGVVTSTR